MTHKWHKRNYFRIIAAALMLWAAADLHAQKQCNSNYFVEDERTAFDRWRARRRQEWRERLEEIERRVQGRPRGAR
jgi:hypothetical protein